MKGHLPVLVLGLLDEKPLHGYAICEALSSAGKGSFGLGEGTLYPLLHRLERQGHVTAEWERGESGKMRKVYKLTKSGRAVIANHHADFRELAMLFSSVFGKSWSSA